MHPIEAIIFDKDGTLHDTERVFQRAWRLAADELGVPDIETTARDCTGRPIQDIAIYWARKYPDIPFEVYRPLRKKYFNALIADGIPLKPGACELLRDLRIRGYRIGLATSTGTEEALEHLRRTGMDGAFDAVVTGDMVERGKPAPDIFLLAAKELGVDPAACVGVEDSVNGVLAVCAAGMRAIMVPDVIPPTPELEAMLWAKCRSLSEILPLLEAFEQGMPDR